MSDKNESFNPYKLCISRNEDIPEKKDNKETNKNKSLSSYHGLYQKILFEEMKEAKK